FGFSIATTGTDVLVGVPLAGARDVGLAYLLDGLTGAPRVIFQKPIPVAGDFFGAAVAADGDEVLVGAPLDSEPAPNAGAAHLFSGGTGALLQTFPNPAQGAFDHFGFALAAGPSGLLVGAPGPSRVYVFRPTGQASALRAETIRTAARGPRCGNGIVEPGEECDDGNAVDTDDCRNDCTRPICCTLDPLQ